MDLRKVYREYKKSKISKKEYLTSLLEAADRFLQSFVEKHCQDQQNAEDMLSDARLLIMDAADDYDPCLRAISVYFKYPLERMFKNRYCACESYEQLKEAIDQMPAAEDEGELIYSLREDLPAIQQKLYDMWVLRGDPDSEIQKKLGLSAQDFEYEKFMLIRRLRGLVLTTETVPEI